MAYTVYLKRSPNGTTWTTLQTWVTNGGGMFLDIYADTPGAGTFYYEMEITSTDSGDVAGPRRLALIAGNR